MNENSRPRIPNEWVRYMYEKLESGELTYATVLKKVPYSYQNVTIFKQISRNTLKKAFKEIGGTPKIKSAPPQEELTPELILKVQNSYENYKCGVQKIVLDSQYESKTILNQLQCSY
ncbi:hypothetical protein TVAG_179000 [Trichomonas vaginalis G3]|uniref:Uncharacterized protein n=1 Tax=Trichomonas vaginalis (strain ATCC PRA-98 / G3) TaxID=412133 RepID=A2G4R8_TRIV3|nr:transposase-related family [Trichomonas vaginalis G3]EAX87849.1 hypothetical protein TVAG_179000 [Trichomonas vaginalis G3]KAI5502155.1 transposase-related family [Trichomonas vaginalis G3]|eukprot:XP_001300779.1 hypothetical protein [Trichomonas vaginalis G3]